MSNNFYDFFSNINLNNAIYYSIAIATTCSFSYFVINKIFTIVKKEIIETEKVDEILDFIFTNNVFECLENLVLGKGLITQIFIIHEFFCLIINSEKACLEWFTTLDSETADKFIALFEILNVDDNKSFSVKTEFYEYFNNNITKKDINNIILSIKNANADIFYKI